MRHVYFFPTFLAFLVGHGGHSDNPVFRNVVAEGLTLDGTTVLLPAPTLADGLDADQTKEVLRKVAGNEDSARQLLRKSVTAPFILKTRDVMGGKSIIRVVDLWFVVHARLEEIDPDRPLRQSDVQAVEAGNMRFESKILSQQDLKDRKIDPLPATEGRKEWYTHLTGRLLDRIKVEATDHSVLTRSADSLIVATQTDQTFGADGSYPDRWSTLDRKGKDETIGPRKPYLGGVSYVKITKLAAEPERALRGGPPRLRRAAGLVPGQPDPPLQDWSDRPGSDPAITSRDRKERRRKGVDQPIPSQRPKP